MLEPLLINKIHQPHQILQIHQIHQTNHQLLLINHQQHLQTQIHNKDLTQQQRPFHQPQSPSAEINKEMSAFHVLMDTLFQATLASQWIQTVVLTSWLQEDVLPVFLTSNCLMPIPVFLNKLLLKFPTVKSLIQKMPDIASSVLMDFTQLEQLAPKFQDSVMDITFKQETVLPVNSVWNWSMENVLIEIVILYHLLKCVPHVLTIINQTQMVSVNSQTQTALLPKTENVIHV